MSLLNAFGGGLWIIPLVILLGSLWSFYRGYRQWKSGSTWDEVDQFGKRTIRESDERVKFLSVGANVFGIVLAVVFVVVVLAMYGDR